MRSKAIQLLSDVDPEMAAKIKICMEESRISLKSLSKDSNVEDALGSFAFTKDDYYAGGLKPVRPKVKKQNVSTVEPQEKSAIEVLVENEFDTTTLTALNLCEPTTSAFADLTMPKTSELNAKFIPLWSDLSKIMQRVVKDTPKELNDTVAEGEMSPMNEADMMSLLNGISFDDERDNDVFESLKEIHEIAQNQKQVEGLLKEYLNLLEKFVQEFKY
uniref:Uncharacterized protein n=1 Tax=Panagrolaimus sp. ES5 TaxID=591445 RepID=A0AC34GED8_9BILA